MTNILKSCFSNKVTLPKMEEYINFYNLKDKDDTLNNFLKDMFRRGYTLPEPYATQAKQLCAFGR